MSESPFPWQDILISACKPLGGALVTAGIPTFPLQQIRRYSTFPCARLLAQAIRTILDLDPLIFWQRFGLRRVASPWMGGREGRERSLRDLCGHCLRVGHVVASLLRRGERHDRWLAVTYFEPRCLSRLLLRDLECTSRRSVAAIEVGLTMGMEGCV